jgi:peptidoglycan L-alanyl-D-glutamate endopeptidase CwlK
MTLTRVCRFLLTSGGSTMAADLGQLVAEFRGTVETLIAKCGQRGIEMRPNSTLRTPFDQARLWRQSRAFEEIQEKIDSFRTSGAEFLAFCIESVGPQHGDPVTKAPPGFSWHQWGEALDCFWLLNGKAEWSTVKKVNGVNGYHVYAEEAEELGLTAGGHWPTFKDWPHVQVRAASSPNKIMSIQEINDEMKVRFG